MANDLHALRRRQPDAAPHPALSQRADQRSQTETKHARETVSLRRDFRRRPQRAHAQDEMYYAIAGRARIRVGDEAAPVTRGSVIFVEAGVPHRFHSITEDLTLLVAFAPGG